MTATMPGNSKKSSATEYLATQVEAIQTLTPVALGGFDAKAIHQCRVATRRLKAGLDLVAPLLPNSATKNLSRAGRKLRRRLGPLRDLDVMIEHLGDEKVPDSMTGAVQWLKERLLAEREVARQADVKKHKAADRAATKFQDWNDVRPLLDVVAPALGVLLADALHARFDEFAKQADLVVNDTPGVDVHQVRINGKALRYTLEIAEAQGLRVPSALQRTFKTLQQALGDWHDRVVMAETCVRCWGEAGLAHHSPTQANTALRLAQHFQTQSTRHLSLFKTRWRRSKEKMTTTIRTKVSLTRPVLFKEPKTVPGPTVPAETSSAAVPSTSDHAGGQG